MYDRSKLKWNKNKLLVSGKVVMSYVPDDTHPGMFRLRWPDGVLSADFYNLTRAKDNAMGYAQQLLNKEAEDQP